jgi:hypothetical protein
MSKDKAMPATADSSFNGDLDALPKKHHHPEQRNATEREIAGKKLDYGKMNLADAKRSGYTDQDGNAVDMAKKDREGSPTGAYTDIGAGRSSVVRHDLTDHRDDHKAKN